LAQEAPQCSVELLVEALFHDAVRIAM
jgi:hypothetical protein